MNLVVIIKFATYDILNWLENSDIDYDLKDKLKKGPGPHGVVVLLARYIF